MTSTPKGPQASRFRQQKFEGIKKLKVPPDALPGSLALTHSRCGKAGCHCRDGEGHASWSLTFMVNGRKRVEKIPPEWVEEVRRQVEAGRAFKEAWTKILVANAELLVLRRQQRAR